MINYKIVSSMPNIIEIKTETISLLKDCIIYYFIINYRKRLYKIINKSTINSM